MFHVVTANIVALHYFRAAKTQLTKLGSKKCFYSKCFYQTPSSNKNKKNQNKVTTGSCARFFR